MHGGYQIQYGILCFMDGKYVGFFNFILFTYGPLKFSIGKKNQKSNLLKIIFKNIVSLPLNV